MYVQLNCVIVDSDPSNRQELANFLGQFGMNLIGQFPTCETLPALLSREDAPHLVIVNLDPNAPDILKKVGHLPRQFPNTSFFLMSSLLDANLLMEAMHLGVKEFIPLPISEDKFSKALDNVANLHGMGKNAQIIHVVPTMGGCGSTTVACNIAASLTKIGKTVLLDMDLVRGGVASYFDLRPRYTISDVMESAERVDRQLLDNALSMHAPSGLAVLSRPEKLEDTQRVTPAAMQRLLGILSRSFDYVVIDSLMSIDPVYATLVQSADVNLVVMQLNVPSAKNAERYVTALRRTGIDAAKIRMVVNRFVKKGWDIDPAEVERALGLKIGWMVPNDFKTAIESINFGQPIVIRSPKAEISTSLAGLAGTLRKAA